MRFLGRWNGSDAPGIRATRVSAFPRGHDDEEPDKGEKTVTRLLPAAGTGGFWTGTDAAGRRLAARRIGADLELAMTAPPGAYREAGEGEDEGENEKPRRPAHRRAGARDRPGRR